MTASVHSIERKMAGDGKAYLVAFTINDHVLVKTMPQRRLIRWGIQYAPCPMDIGDLVWEHRTMLLAEATARGRPLTEPEVRAHMLAIALTA